MKFYYKHFVCWRTPDGISHTNDHAVNLEKHSALGAAVAETDVSVRLERALWINHIGIWSYFMPCQPTYPIVTAFPVFLAFLTAFNHFIPLLFKWQVKYLHKPFCFLIMWARQVTLLRLIRDSVVCKADE